MYAHIWHIPEITAGAQYLFLLALSFQVNETNIKESTGKAYE